MGGGSDNSGLRVLVSVCRAKYTCVWRGMGVEGGWVGRGDSGCGCGSSAEVERGVFVVGGWRGRANSSELAAAAGSFGILIPASSCCCYVCYCCYCVCYLQDGIVPLHAQQQQQLGGWVGRDMLLLLLTPLPRLMLLLLLLLLLIPPFRGVATAPAASAAASSLRTAGVPPPSLLMVLRSYCPLCFSCCSSSIFECPSAQ